MTSDAVRGRSLQTHADRRSVTVVALALALGLAGCQGTVRDSDGDGVINRVEPLGEISQSDDNDVGSGPSDI